MKQDIPRHMPLEPRVGLLTFWVGAWLALVLPTSAQSFTEIAASLPGVRSGSVAWGDCDNDGDLDLLIIGNTGTNSVARVYRNDGNGVFTDLAAGLPGVAEGAVAWADYNGDGWLDFAMTGDGETALFSRIYRNNGNSTFTDISAGLPGLGSATLSWGDFDNDGDLDLFLTGYNGSAYVGKIFRNDSGDVFTDSGISNVAGGAAGSAAWGDFDADGDMDLMFSAFTGDTTYGQSSRLYRNNNGVFTNITAFSLTAMSYASVAWGDYDNDGDLDLLMAGSSIAGVQSYPTLRLYRNNTSGASFTSVSSGMTGAQHCSLAWGDYDNDGDLDVAVAGYHTDFTPMARLYINLGGGTFFNTGVAFTPVIEAALAWGDYDGDGDLDLLLTGFDGVKAITKLYRNDNFFANTPPTSPWGLSAFVTGRTATLSWNPGGDADQTGGLSYNLRVGTAAGADNVMAGMADPTTGLRRTPRLGNASQRLSWPLKLPVGGYYWSAQAIDHNFAGSAFAPEQYFEIPVQAPEVATLTASNVALSSVTLRATANPNGDATRVHFEYGTTTNYGSASPSQNLGNGVSEISVAGLVTNLLPATTYQFRAVAGNNFGTNYGINRSFTTPTFVEVTNTAFVGVGNGSIAWGDYNNDGFLDVLVGGVNSTGAVTRVYRNLGGTNFLEAVTNLAGVNYGTAAWGDYDNDGDLDVLLTGVGAARIYRNEGGDVFTDINAGLPGAGSGATAVWADMDNDGDLDFALAGAGTTFAYLYRNDGNDLFTSVTNSLLRMNECALAWADYDNDGDNDLLTAGYNYGASSLGEVTRLYRNDGHGNLANSPLNFQGLYRSAVSWGDYDNDGDLDLLASGSQFSTRYRLLYTNRNDGTFGTVAVSALPRVDQGNIAWGDYDNDGDLDILVVGQASTGAVAQVYRNDVTVFRDSGTLLPLLGNVRAEWGDFDKDGRLDILQLGYTGSNYVTKLFRNVAPVANTPPVPPQGLTAAVTNNAVWLNWNAASDANQSGGLTYNVRVGTTAGGSDVLGGMASLATGFRRLPRLGNAGLRLNSTLTNLLVGNYYWSVQAVDHAYVGSTFSTNGTFTITAAVLPPVVVTKPGTNITLASARVAGLGNAKGAASTAWFQFGNTTNFGSTTPIVNIGSGLTNVSLLADLTNLNDGTTYYFRAAASNVNGTVFGATLSFTTGFMFSNVVVSLPAFGSGGAAWGDFDNDGDLDVAIGGNGQSATQVYRNDGNGLFTVVATNLPNARYGGMEWGDYNRDGNLDLLIFGEPTMSVARNEGGGSFTTVATFSDGLFGYLFATWVDYDSDGDPDIACYDSVGQNQAYAYARIYRNDGGTFEPSGVAMPRMTWGGMAWADYDRDGDPDLAISGQFIITNYIVPLTRIYRNDGNGDLTDIGAPLAGLEYSRLAWGDYDNDGDLDLLCTGRDNSGLRTILYRNDAGTFVDANIGLPGSSGEMGWVDYDNDGDLDLHLNFDGQYFSTNRIYRNDGNGSFTDSGRFFLGSTTSYYVPVAAVNWADYDRDGDLDVLVNSALYRNNLPTSNTPPTAPAGLTSTPTGNLVTLQWSPATDVDQPGGLGYNLQMGTSPGGFDVLSPAADAAGWRRLSRAGPAAHPVWKLWLPVGTYHWKVQAIDHGRTGSAFSGEDSFSVPVQTPVALTLPGTTNADLEPRLHGSVNPNGSATTVYFDYGATTNFGSRTPPQSVGSGTGWLSVAADLSGLAPEGAYYFRLVASNSLGMSFGLTRSVWQPWFTDRTPAFGYMTGASWADTDNDGDFELSIQAYYGTYVYQNLAGTFTNQVTDWAGISFGGMGWGDYDNDGDLDAFVTGRDSNFARQAKLFRNDGNHTYTEIPTPITPGFSGTVNWADLDNDGDLDLVVTGENQQGAAYTQVGVNAPGGFELKPTTLPGLRYGAVACADYDNDGDVDILLGGQGQGGGLCQLFANDGQANFTDSGTVLPPLREVSLAWGDCDNDGDLDILINGRDDTATNYVAKVFRNDAGTFTDANAGLPGIMGCSAWFDYDNDGWLDILLGGITNLSGDYVMRVFRNLGGGTFMDSGLQPAPASSTQVGAFPADYDNDGDQDVMFAFGRLLRNEGLTTNIIPGVPTGLTSVVASNSASLSWRAASDANQSGGLTYNVRIGVTPGSGEAFSAMSLADGRRLVPEFGNAFARTNLPLRNLKVGTYYWSVQAIDHAHAGSGFSTNGMFVIPAQKPSLTTLTHSNLLANSVTLVGRVNPNGAATVASYQYGLTTNYGATSSSQNLGSGADALPLVANLTNLNFVATYHYRLVASNSFGVAYGADQQFATPQFTEVSPGFPASLGAIALADPDQDGDLDVALTIHTSAASVLYHNLGNLAFTNSGASFAAVNNPSLDWGDYDQDGDLDLLVSGFNATRIYRNDGNSTFTDSNAPLPVTNGSANWGDFDNDGDLDVLLSAWQTGWKVYRNLGNGQFALFQSANAPGGSGNWADYDNDGDLDILVTGGPDPDHPFAQLLRNDGAAGFVDSGVPLPKVRGFAAWGDYDRDGDLDLLLSGAEDSYAGAGPTQTHLYRNDGGGQFTDVPTGLTNLATAHISGRPVWFDFDNDGDLDIALASAQYFPKFTKIFRNDGGSAFSELQANLVQTEGNGIATGDFDNDGDLDLLVSGLSGGTYAVRLYQNHIVLGNPPPAAPTGLSAVMTGAAVTLGWNAATDANQSGGLSYNLRVGTTPGGSQVVSPDSAANGLRRVARLGNVQANLRWSLTNLPVGTYYWSVQAVDNAYAGSAFAPEKSFFRNAPPVAQPQLLVLGEDSPQPVTLTATEPDGQAVTFSVTANPTNGVLTGTPPNLVYRPNTNYFGADRLLFQVHDGFTNSAPALVSLLVTQITDVAAARLAIQPPANGQTRLTLTGEPYERYRLEASGDLVHWVALTNLVSSNGLAVVMVNDSATFPHRFYRAAWAPPPATVGSPASLPDAGFQFAFGGELARRYEIQASTNLVSWSALTRVLLTNSPATFTDPQAPDYSHRFYRIVPLP